MSYSKALLFVLSLTGIVSADTQVSADNIVDMYAKENLIPVVVIGAGPAGYAAAMQAGRAGIVTTVYAGKVTGGQITYASMIENWPALKAQPGYQIMQDFKEQIERFGANIIEESITHIDANQWPFKLTTSDNKTVHALSIIIATGSAPRRLGVPNEERYVGRGVSSCALCDCIFFRNKEVYVVGGSDTVIDQALQLIPYAKRITLLVRQETEDAVRRVQDTIKQFDNVTVEYTKEVTSVQGNGKILTGITLYDPHSKRTEEVPADGLFVTIGHNPNTDLFKGVIALDEAGYVELEGRTQQTSVKGIFAAGDVERNRYRQAIIAAGSGAKAALEAIRFLRDMNATDFILQKTK